jgi:hypothetical protein
LDAQLNQAMSNSNYSVLNDSGSLPRQKCLLTSQFFTLPVTLSGHIFTSPAKVINRFAGQWLEKDWI